MPSSAGMPISRPFALCLFVASALNGQARAAEKVVYDRDIRPILSDHCYQCHGPDKSHRKGDLRLDLRDEAVKQEVVVPGKPEESELIARIESDDPDEVMPPPRFPKKLGARQKDLLKRWVAEGAVYQGHWAYEPPVKPPSTGIDALVEQHLARDGAKLSPEADRRTLIRRLSFDLLGLPPGPEDVEAFLNDNAPGGYEALVEKLLASPHYGERMASGWLDIVRFADTIGYHSDNPRNVWPYRDYVIRSFNRNTPFDQFTVEQLAGDLLPNATLEQKVASCFNHLLLTTEEGGAQPKDYEARMLGDRVRAVGAVWLGQTLGCCQCHDHKYDPATQRDFFALGAFFADIREPIIGRRDPGIFILDEAQTKHLATLQARAILAPSYRQIAPVPDSDRTLRADARKALADFEATLPRCMVTVASAEPRTVRILPRGNFLDESGEVVQPALPAYLAKSGPTSARPLNRLDLARWLVERDNPLTARVFVNRLWKQFFGIGLSKTLDDLGSQGEWPVHPELLDWLARDFMEGGWDVKHLVRTIVNSRTYRQSSAASREMTARDPFNRELGRQGRFRLDAELVRDNALSIAGLLSPRIGGPSVKPYQPDGYWENLNFPPRQYVADTGESQHRRGLYTWWQRSFPHPSLLAFDAPSREECTADRGRSDIPQQALVLLNDPTYVEASRVFAALVLKEGGSETPARLDWAWRQALQRPPRDDERATLTALIEKHQRAYAEDRPAAEALLKVGQAPVPSGTDAAELAAWTNAARAILNLHETMTRN